MRKRNFILLVLLLLGIALAYAAPITLIYKDNTQTTKNLALLEDPAYPNATPTTYPRFFVQAYKSTDNVIDPLGADGLPTGDDVAVTSVGGSGTLAFGPTGTWTTSPNMTAIDPVAEPLPSVVYHSSGNKIYYRVFNSTSIATATKCIQATSLYTVLSASTTVSTYIPTYGWSSWITFAGPTGYSLSVDSNYLGADILKDGFDTGFDTPHLFEAPAEAGVYTVVMPNVAWTPASFNFTAEADATIRFIGVKTPGPALNPNPANNAQLHIAWDALAIPYNLTWEAPAGLAPDGYLVNWMGVQQADIPAAGLLQWTTPPIAEGLYNWQVIPYITDPVKGVKKLDPVRTSVNANNVKGPSTTSEVWYFEILRDPEPPTPPYMPTPTDGAIDVNPGLVMLAWQVQAPPPPDSFFDVFLSLDPSGFGEPIYTGAELAIQVNNLLPMQTYYWFVRYHDGLTGLFSDSPVWSFTTGDNIVPVELSSFTAVYTAGFFVQLTWVVQTETNHLGYYVLRSNEENLDTATLLHTTPISSGSANGTQITYNFRDEEIQANQTYYYWLESVDMTGQSEFFGPISIITTGENPDNPTPEIPVNTALLNAYPNPFTSQSSIPYYLKNAGDVKIEIYNAKGKLVHYYNASSKAAGYHKISWNGRDLNGRPVSSGIYFYRMTSGKYTASKKIVLVK